MNDKELRDILVEIRDLLMNINKRLEKIETKMDGRKVISDIDSVDPLVLLELPDNLRTSYMVVLQLKEATAEEVAAITKRGRAIESHYLNTLVNMGYLNKKRVGRKVYFYPG